MPAPKDKLTWRGFLKGTPGPLNRVFLTLGGAYPSATARNISRYTENPEELLTELDKVAQEFKKQKKVV